MQAVCPPLYGCVQGTGAPPLCAPGAHARWWALVRDEERRRGLGVDEKVTAAQNALAPYVLGVGKKPAWSRGIGITRLRDGRDAVKVNVSRMADVDRPIPREVMGVPVVVAEVGDIPPRASYDFWRRMTGLGGDEMGGKIVSLGERDQARTYGAAIGASIAGLSVLGLGAYIGSRLSSRQHKTRGALVGAGVAVLPAYMAAMMGGMIMGGIASGTSPV